LPAIFLDASAIVPLQVQSDQWYEASERVMRALRAQRGVHYVTTNWTLYEAVSLARRSSAAQSVALFARMVQLSQIVGVTREIELAAVDRFLRWTDKGASVVDHANLLVAESHRCEAILSFDRDFIPLAAAAGLRILR
jgi:predicted nucleic acid-binding protein